jgi:two-component sensor histidine kinase
MKALTLKSVQELLAESEPPCMSLYMATHKTHPENLQDTIRFQNLVKQLEESLLLQSSSTAVKKLLEPFEALYQNSEFW